LDDQADFTNGMWRSNGNEVLIQRFPAFNVQHSPAQQRR
jgi:hypothetical protein